MDNSSHPTSGINPHSYPSPAPFSPPHGELDPPPPRTLLPLQPSTTSMQPMCGSNPHTPRTGTPNTPNSAHSLPPSSPQSNQTDQRGGMYSMAQNPYPPHTGYGTLQPMMPGAATAASHPQSIAPAPAGGRGPPVLHPMPPGGLMGQNGVGSPYGPGPMMPQNGVMGENEQAVHVVGSQSRRGILPSAPGRPAAPAAGTSAAKNTVIPVKDADGKFPCPHCTKTYLHAKHLKRHLLRHTGDRPYMCVLCRDTFSRSDILKRHFQKCSIRRGSPTGASHLSHHQVHVKKNAHAKKAQGMPDDGMLYPFDVVKVQDSMNGMPGDQHQLSCSSSMGGMDNAANADRGGMAPPGMCGGQPYGGDINSMNGQNMHGYNVPPGQSGIPMYGGNNYPPQSSLDWTQTLPPGDGAQNRS